MLSKDEMEKAKERLNEKLVVADSTMSNRIVLTEEDAETALSCIDALLSASDMFNPKHLICEHKEIKIGDKYIKGIDARYSAGYNDRADEDIAVLAKKLEGIEEVLLQFFPWKTSTKKREEIATAIRHIS